MIYLINWSFVRLQAKTPEDAAQGLVFMKEMMELTNQQSANPITQVQAVFYETGPSQYEVLNAGPSHFSPELTEENSVKQKAVFAKPFQMCSGEKQLVIGEVNCRLQSTLLDLENSVSGFIVLAKRGSCTFIEKARKAQAAGAIGMIIVDDSLNTSSKNQPMFAMSGDGTDDVTIPVVFLFQLEGVTLMEAVVKDPDLEVEEFSWRV